MAWMAGHEGGMPGLAMDDEIAELEGLAVPQMEEQYLRMMIYHHRGAVPMADYAADRAESPELAGLARGMEQGQAAEIALMQDMLVARGDAREPEGTDAHGGHG